MCKNNKLFDVECLDKPMSECYIDGCKNKIEYRVWLGIASCTVNICSEHLEQFINDANSEYDELKEILEDEQKLKNKKAKFNKDKF